MSDTQKFWSKRVISGRGLLTRVEETFLGKFLSFEGRIGRLSHYFRIVALVLPLFIVFAVTIHFFGEMRRPFELAISAVVIMLSWPFCCVMAKRLHDLGVSGLWGVIGWATYWGVFLWVPESDIPMPYNYIFAFLALGSFWMMLAPGQKKENEYGKPQSR